MRKFSLGLNAAKITDYNKKNASNKSCSYLNFLQKKSVGTYDYLPKEIGMIIQCDWKARLSNIAYQVNVAYVTVQNTLQKNETLQNMRSVDTA